MKCVMCESDKDVVCINEYEHIRFLSTGVKHEIVLEFKCLECEFDWKEFTDVNDEKE